MSDHLKRGNLLWEGSRMFLPEHKQALIQRQSQKQKVKRPTLDDQQLAEMDDLICEAMAENKTLCFIHHENGAYKTLVGNVQYYDEVYRQLRIQDHFHEVHILDLGDIVNLSYN